MWTDSVAVGQGIGSMRSQQTTTILFVLVAFNVILIFLWIREPILEDRGGGPEISERMYGGLSYEDPYRTPKPNPVHEDLTDVKESLRAVVEHLAANDPKRNVMDLFELIRNNHDSSMEILHKLMQNLTSSQNLLKEQFKEKSFLVPTQLPGKVADNAAINVTSRLNVLVMASMRTGSSFFGEMFNRHPKFLYFFEPPKGLYLNDYDPMLTVRGAELLHDIYKCNYSGIARTILDNLYNPVSPLAKTNVVRAWVTDEFCSGWNPRGKIFAKCVPMTPEAASKSCRIFDKVVVKEIRVYDVFPLLHLVNDPDVNLRIINLIRDPRGVMSSVMPIHISNWQARKKSEVDIKLNETQFDEELLRRLDLYCTTMLRNVLISKHAVRLPKGNYMAVRYEDLSEDPIGTIQNVYKFLGVEVHDNVKRWIDENTKQDNNASDIYYAWATKRNSKETSQFWRQKLSFALVKKIENTGDCSYLLNTLGYRKAESQEQLLNSSVSFVLPSF